MFILTEGIIKVGSGLSGTLSPTNHVDQKLKKQKKTPEQFLFYCFYCFWLLKNIDKWEDANWAYCESL